MKKYLIVLVVLATVLSCTSIPSPEGESNSLVIGSFILDFPDGFFDLSPRKFEMNVELRFRNVTQDSTFSLRTTRGYFYFLTNGTDQYVLESYNLPETKIGDTVYTFGGRKLEWKIDPSPGKVIYLGHITFTEAASDASKRKGRTTYFEFDPSVAVDWDKNAIQQYIKDKDDSSPWLAYEVVELGKR